MHPVVAGERGTLLPGELRLHVQHAVIRGGGAFDVLVLVVLGQLLYLGQQGIDGFHHLLDVFLELLLVIHHVEVGFTLAFKSDGHSFHNIGERVAGGSELLRPAVQGKAGILSLLGVPVVIGIINNFFLELVFRK